MTAISPQKTQPPSTEAVSTPQGVRQLSAIYFLNFASRGWAMPFISLYMVAVGFSATEIGFVVSARALVNMIGSPVVNSIADATGQHRRLFYALVVLMALAIIGLAAPVHTLWVAAMVIVWNMAGKSLVALQAQLTISWLRLREREIYGRVRAWGSLGWSATTFAAGTLLAIGGYPLMFVLSGLLNLLILPLAWVLPERTNNIKKETGPGAPRQTGFYIYLAAKLVYYIGGTSYGAFAFIYMEQVLGADPGMIGMLVGVVALAEIGPMILMDRLLRRIDVRLTMVVGMVGLAVTLIALAMLEGAALLLPLMLLRGVMQTFTIISTPLLVAQISHPANLARNQSLAGATAQGLAAFIAGPMMGIIYDTVGGSELFLIAGTICLASGVGLLILRRYLVPPIFAESVA